MFSWASEKMNVKFQKNCENTGKILKISCQKMYFCEIGHSFSRAPMRSFLWCYYSWFITSLALEKCKKEFIILEIILVQDFCPLKIKITQFPDGFRLNYLKQWRHSLLKKDRERFRGLPTDVKFTINRAKLMFIFVIHRLAIQILPRIYFSCGGAAGNFAVKKTHKNVWAFK